MLHCWKSRVTAHILPRCHNKHDGVVEWHFKLQALDDLLEYLDNNLLVMNNNLLKANFDRILESIWVEVLEEFKDALETEEMVNYIIIWHHVWEWYIAMQ